MENSTENKWYQRKWLLILLLFIAPLIGIIGIILRKTKVWKKVVYILSGLFTSFFLLGIVLSLIMPNVYYTNGNRLFEKGKYNEAIEEYQKVAEDDENYSNAIDKIAKVQFKIDSISSSLKVRAEQAKKDSLEKIEKERLRTKNFRMFQENWADSLMNACGVYLNSFVISDKGDRITFYLNPEIGKFSNIDDINMSLYQKDYDKRTNNNSSVKIDLKLDPQKEQRRLLIDKQFSGWDGSHRNLVRYVKNNMNDKSSFEHIETTYTDKGSYVLVFMKFRGSNAFGAIVINTIKAKVDMKGNILSVE